MSLFRRTATLTVETLKVECGGTAGLDIDFDVVKTATPEADSSKLTIYNLSKSRAADLRQRASKPGKKVHARLEAGHVGSTTLICSGEFDYVTTRREGPDLITEIYMRDGAQTMATNALSKSYARGTQLSTVLKDLAAACEFDFGNLADALVGAQIDGVGTIFRTPIAVNGNAWAALTKLAASAGLEVSVVDGKLQFIQAGGGLKTRATLLSSETGLVDSPNLGTSPTGKLLRCKALIQPGLEPGRQIKLNSEFVQGAFVVRKAHYVGSTWGTDWYASIEAKPL